MKKRTQNNFFSRNKTSRLAAFSSLNNHNNYLLTMTDDHPWTTRITHTTAVVRQTATTSSSTSIVEYPSNTATYKSFHQFASTVDPTVNSTEAVRKGWKALHNAIFSGLDFVDQFGTWLNQSPYRTRYLAASLYGMPPSCLDVPDAACLLHHLVILPICIRLSGVAANPAFASTTNALAFKSFR